MNETSGEVVSAYIDKELDREQQRKQSLETRAAIIVSGSVAGIGALVAILGYLHDRQSELFQGANRDLLYAGLLTLGASVVGGLLTLRPRRHTLLQPVDLDHYIGEDTFYKDATYSQRRIATVRLTQLKSLTELNSSLARQLLLSQIVQLAGVVCAATAIFRVLR